MPTALSTKHSALPPDGIAAGLPVVIDDGSQYVYGAGLEEMLSGRNTYYYLADGLGSTMAMVDATGTVQKSYTYDVYGKPTATGALANEFDFAGQQTDPTGLQYLRARYFDPETGVFISREPLAALPAWMGNPHGYASGNPARLADPSGRYPVDSDPAAPSDCLHAYPQCDTYGPSYDYGYPDAQPHWGDGDLIDYGDLYDKAKYVGNPAGWAADALNVVAELNPSYLADYRIASFVAALWSAVDRDYASALLILSTISAGPEWIFPLVLFNDLLHDFVDPHPPVTHVTMMRC